MKLIKTCHSRTLFITSILVGLAACTFVPSRQASNAQKTTAQQPSSNSDRQCTLVENNFGASGTVNVAVEEVATGLFGVKQFHQGEQLFILVMLFLSGKVV